MQHRKVSLAQTSITSAFRSSLSSLPEYKIHREFKADDHRDNSHQLGRGLFDMDVERLPQQYVEGKEKAEKKKIECRGTLGHSFVCGAWEGASDWARGFLLKGTCSPLELLHLLYCS